MTALLLAALVACALGGILAGLRIARWAAVERAIDIYGARRRAEDRATYAFQRLDVARADALPVAHGARRGGGAVMYRTLSMPAAPLARPSLPWSKRVLHQIVRRFDLDQNVRWRRLAGGRWARFTLVEPNTTEAPDDLHDRVVRRYGDDSNASWAKAMRPQWHPMLGCPCIIPPPMEVCPHGVLARDCACGDCRCEVWP